MATDGKINNDVTATLSQDQIDYLAMLNDVPSARLDADMYQADDIDGGTEGLTGSGNLNYLVLQSRQTDDASHVNDPFASANDDIDADGLGGLGRHGIGGLAGAGNASAFRGAPGETTGAGFDEYALNDLSLQEGALGSVSPMESAATSVNAPSIDFRGGSSYSDDDYFNYQQTTSMDPDPVDPTDPTDPTDPVDPTDPTDPTDPVDPVDPVNPGGPGNTPDTDLTLDLDTGIIDTDLDLNLDPIEDILGDIDIDIDGVIGDLLGDDLLDTIGLDVVGTLLGEDLDLGLDTVTDLIDGALSGVTDTINDILGETTGLLDDTLGGLTGLDLFDDSGTDDLDLAVDIAAPVLGLENFNTDVLLDPVEAVVGDIDVGIGTGLFEGGILGGLLGGDSAAGPDEYDLVTNLDIPVIGHLNLDIPLDLLEGIVGDIDILATIDSDLDGTVSDLLGGDLLEGLIGADTALAPVGDLVSDLSGLLDANMLDDALTPVTSLVEDLGAELLGNEEGSLGGAIGSLVDSDILNIGDEGLMGIVSDITGGLGDVLPELDSVGDLLSPVTDMAGDLLGGDLPGNDLLSPVTDIVENLLDGAGPGGDILAPISDLAGEVTGGDVLSPVTDIVDSLFDGNAPGGDVLSPVTDIAGDLLGGDVPGGELLAPLTGLVEDIFDGGAPGDNIIAPVTDIVGDLAEGIMGSGDDNGCGCDILQPAADIAGSVVGIVPPVVEDITGLVGDDVIPAITGIVDDLTSGDILDGGIFQTVTDTLDGALGEGLPGGDAGGLIDTAGNLVDDALDLLSGGGNPGGDTDLVADAGLDVLGVITEDLHAEIVLDPVEALVGDIDIDAETGLDLTPDFSDGLDSLAGSIGVNLAVDVEIDLLDPLFGEDGLELAFNTADITGGISGSINDALNNPLGDHMDDPLGDLWADAGVLDGLLDGVGGLAGGLGGGAGAGVPSLPEPVGVITQGLGNVIEDLGGGLLGGGHHGHGGFGGLFG